MVRQRSARRPADTGRLLLGLALLLTGCASRTDHGSAPAMPRFFLEAANGEQAVELTLPTSGTRLAISPRPVLTEFDVTAVEVIPLELGEALRFQVTAAAARALYRLTAGHQGRRLVLLINGAPFGARVIDGPWSGGELVFYAEVPDAELPPLLARLRRGIAVTERGGVRGP